MKPKNKADSPTTIDTDRMTVHNGEPLLSAKFSFAVCRSITAKTIIPIVTIFITTFLTESILGKL